MPEPVVIVDYDPDWPRLFDEFSAPLFAELGDLIVAVEHVGSTAVPGLVAKPIIDLDLVVPSASDIPLAVARLAVLGYVHLGDVGIPGREAFLWPAQKARHHLYVCPVDSEELDRHRSFRDYLLTHPDEANAYGALKKAAAIRYSDDRDAYVGAKSSFVESVLKRACSSKNLKPYRAME